METFFYLFITALLTTIVLLVLLIKSNLRSSKVQSDLENAEKEANRLRLQIDEQKKDFKYTSQLIVELTGN